MPAVGIGIFNPDKFKTTLFDLAPSYGKGSSSHQIEFETGLQQEETQTSVSSVGEPCRDSVLLCGGSHFLLVRKPHIQDCWAAYLSIPINRSRNLGCLDECGLQLLHQGSNVLLWGSIEVAVMVAGWLHRDKKACQRWERVEVPSCSLMTVALVEL
eukprot:1159027-Pelagomonas_calceolata.AAC.2